MDGVSAEIKALQADEATLAAEAAEGDRLMRELVSVYACDFVIVAGMPPGTWAALPDSGGGQVTWEMLRQDWLPRDLRGRVGVSMEMLRWLAHR